MKSAVINPEFKRLFISVKNLIMPRLIHIAATHLISHYPLFILFSNAFLLRHLTLLSHAASYLAMNHPSQPCTYIATLYPL
jgi:hypothetical protein